MAATCLVAACLTGCAVSKPAAPGELAGPGERAGLTTASATDTLVIDRSSGEGARWIDLSVHQGPDGPVLAGRFSVVSPPFLGSRTVLVQGRDSRGELLFENRTLASPTSARTTRNHRQREEGFSMQLPSTSDLRSLSVTAPARAAAH